SFEELDKLVRHRSHNFGMQRSVIDGDGFVTGHGLMHGRQMFVFAQDFTVFGGSLSEANAQKIVKVMDLALKTGAPIIGLNDSGGAVTHNSTSGVAQFLAADDEDCLRTIRELIRFLPQNNLDGVPPQPTTDVEDRADRELDTLIPPESNKPYDIKDVITRVTD